MGFRERMLGDPSLSSAERRARARAMWRDPRVLVPWSLFVGAALVLTSRDGDESWPVLVGKILVSAVVAGVVMAVISRVWDR